MGPQFGSQEPRFSSVDELIAYLECAALPPEKLPPRVTERYGDFLLGSSPELFSLLSDAWERYERRASRTSLKPSVNPQEGYYVSYTSTTSVPSPILEMRLRFRRSVLPNFDSSTEGNAFLIGYDREGIPFGYIHFGEYDSFEIVKDPNEVHIYELWVEESYRGHHCGSFLVRKLERYCRNKGVTKITLEATDDSLNFYNHIGYDNNDLKDELSLEKDLT